MLGDLRLSYKGQRVLVGMGETPKELPLGKVAFTEAGKQLSTLCQPDPVPGFVDYVAEHWRANGLTVTLVPAENAVPA